MIYEVRTYTLKPGSTAEFEKRWAPMVEERNKLSPFGGLFHTDIGPLNQMIHIWPYESVEERTRIRAEAVAKGVWPPPTGELMEKQESEILLPAPFMRPLKPAKLGNVYELRIYTIRPGGMQQVLKLWSERIEEREKHSPLAACWYSEVGALNRFFHLWAYESLNDRDRVRAEAAKGNWPPPTREFIQHQENKILIPAAFSPLH